MKQNKLIYAFILLGITFLLIYVNKKIFLESYTYNKDLTFNSLPNNPNVPLQVMGDSKSDMHPVHASTCKKECDYYPNCTGFITDMIDTPDDSGVGSCTLYNHLRNDTSHLDGTNLYLK